MQRRRLPGGRSGGGSPFAPPAVAARELEAPRPSPLGLAGAVALGLSTLCVTPLTVAVLIGGSGGSYVGIVLSGLLGMGLPSLLVGGVQGLLARRAGVGVAPLSQLPTALAVAWAGGLPMGPLFALLVLGGAVSGAFFADRARG